MIAAEDDALDANERAALAELEALAAFVSRPRNLREIGARLGISRERVRQHQVAGLKKLKMYIGDRDRV